MNKKKHISISFSIFIIITLFCMVYSKFITTTLFHNNQIDKQAKSQNSYLSKYANQLILNELSTDMLSLHFCFTSIPDEISKKKCELHFLPRCNSHTYYKNQYNSFHSLLPKDYISPEYETINWYLKNQLLLSDYAYFEEPLSPELGIHTNTFFLLSAYYFNSKEDISNYFSIIKSLPDWVNEIIDYETKKKQANLFMSYNACLEIYKTCMNYASSTDYLLNCFNQHLNDLFQKDLITRSEYNYYLNKHNGYLINYFIPAYQFLGNSILNLADSTRSIHGLSHYTNGKEFYAQYITSITGTHRTINEMLDSYYKDINIYMKMKEISISNKIDFLTRKDSFSDPLTIIQSLMKLTSREFPPLPMPQKNIQISVENIPPILEPTCSSAFYLLSPIDDLNKHTIYINSSISIDSTEFITTMGHEAFPGHLYQHIFSSYETQKTTEVKYINFFSTLGFQEGWGLYSELWANDHIKITDSLYTSNLMSRNSKLLYLTILAYLEINIHYNQWSFQNVQAFLKGYNITDTSYILSIYSYICQNPGVYVQYVEGFSEIQLLKNIYINQYHFNEYDFHCILLKNSFLPFSIFLKSQKYIK